MGKRTTVPRWSAPVLALALLVALVLPAAAQQRCSFRLGFADLAALIPEIVGECLADETHQANGDAVQPTTNGLLVWRKIDNFTAFTDGSTTWINGPFGLQSRPNGERFEWEASAIRPSGPLAVGQTWSEPGLEITLDDVQVDLAGSVPAVTLFYSVRNTSDQTLALAIDQEQGIEVVDNLGARYPLLCCLAQPRFQRVLEPAETAHLFAQYQGDPTRPEVTTLTVTFKRVGPVLDARWQVPLAS